ncbi:hypothetical protein RUND412_005775 [Rhizina undulata]
MDTIPTEVLLEILSYLPQKDLGSMRLANRFFESAVNGLYFRTLRIRVTEAGLANSQQISTRPELAQCVQHIIYPYQRLGAQDNLSGRRQSKASSGGGFEWISDIYTKQKALEESGAFSQVFKLALSKMKNLKHITTNSHAVDKYKQVGHRAKPEIAPAVLRISTTLAVALDSEEAKRLMRNFEDLMNAAALANTKLQTLTTYWLWRDVFTENAQVLSRAQLFQNITSLSIYFGTNFTAGQDAAMREDANQGKIFRFLSSAPKLKTLALGLEWESIGFFESRALLKCAMVPLRKIFGEDYVWRNLETFPFNSTPIHREELMDLLARHAATLKTVGLLSPHLRMGTWRGVLDFVKEKQELRLEKIILIDASEELSNGKLKYYSADSDNRRMSDYALHGGPPFPLTQAELEEVESYDNHED